MVSGVGGHLLPAKATLAFEPEIFLLLGVN